MLMHHEGQTFHCKEVWKFKNRIPRAILTVCLHVYRYSAFSQILLLLSLKTY